MFAISLALVVLISAAILLYQYWSGALAEGEPFAGREAGSVSDFHAPTRDERPTPARAA